MKKLGISLLGDSSGDDTSGYHLAGDTFGGYVHFATSSSVKYTCLQILFIGLVKSKVAKAQEKIFLVNQQHVLLGSPNNATEYTIEEGKHSWPFQFTIPQRTPSSGKYRHGTVKYSVLATLTSSGFLGMKNHLKTSQNITIRDLINVKVEPYSLPFIAKGSSNLQPRGNDPKDMATASVKVASSAFLKGQKVHMEIDLYHPSKIRRNPGCFIQLIRKESYNAGDTANEYTDTIASCAEALMVNSPVNTGKIISELTIPDTATPSMKAAKAIQVEYHLNILFDMREKASSLKARHSKTIKVQDRNMLLSTPGCFEIQVPIIIGTLSDSLHRPKSSPFAHPTAPHHPIIPIHTTPSSSSTLTLSGSSVSPPSLSPSPSPSQSPSTLQQYQVAVREPPLYRISSMDSETLPMRRHQSDLFGASAVTTPYPYRGYSHTIGPSHAPAIDHQNRPTLPQLMEKPLPDVPRRSVHPPPQPPLPLLGAPFVPPPEYSRPRSIISPHGSAFNAMSTPARLPPRPHHIPIMSTERAHVLPMNASGYPLDKFTPAQFTDLPLPVNTSIAQPTAPQAVDLGLEPASPLPEHSLVTPWFPESSSSTQGIIKNTTRLSIGYFPTVLNPSHRVSMMATPTAPDTVGELGGTEHSTIYHTPQ
ncbi:MAG: hypothetical protein J3Q66DRAFT_320290 [Benniella sp.]|nr:MAG: hypothetical protein J3Q66DRAFT_320290 [Benniella sp.]